jgi:hypothetical protein
MYLHAITFVVKVREPVCILSSPMGHLSLGTACHSLYLYLIYRIFLIFLDFFFLVLGIEHWTLYLVGNLLAMADFLPLCPWVTWGFMKCSLCSHFVQLVVHSA